MPDPAPPPGPAADRDPPSAAAATPPLGTRARASRARVPVVRAPLGRAMIAVALVACASVALARDPAAPLADGNLARLEAVERLLDRYGPAAWPGWGPQPLLVRAGPREVLVGYDGRLTPPEGFEPAPGVTLGGGPVAALDGHLTPAPIATSWPVGDGWAVAIPVLDEFQDAIDAALGPGVVTLDDASYVRAVVHEAFHAFQLATFGGPNALPRADEAVDERAVFAAWQRVPDLDARQRAQGRALAEALAAPEGPGGDARATTAVRAFLELRAAWRADAPDGTRALERQVEWIEGLARYADVRVLRLAERDGADGAPGMRVVPTEGTTWAEFLAQLRDPAAIPGGLRDRLYVLGAAQGFALDRLLPGWRARALPGGEALEDLLAEAVGAAAP